MLGGASSICHGIATFRNRKSVAHGKSEGYVRPTADLAQTLNHLAGVISVLVIQHTAAISVNQDSCQSLCSLGQVIDEQAE